MSDQPIYSSFPQDQCKDKTCKGDCDCDDSTGHVAATEIEAQQGRVKPWIPPGYFIMPPMLPQNWTEESYGEKKEPTEAPSYYCDCGTRMYEVAFKGGRATMKCGACGLRMQIKAVEGTTREAMSQEKLRVVAKAVGDAFSQREIKP